MGEFLLHTECQRRREDGAAPASEEVAGKALALIDRALANKRPKPDWAHHYFLFAKGLAEYRLGRFEIAIKIMDGPARSALQSAPRLVLAMARHRLGQHYEALRTFAEAILLSDWRTSPVKYQDPVPRCLHRRGAGDWSR